MQDKIVSIVVGFILRQLAKFGEKTDWLTVKDDIHMRLAPLLPDWSEDAAFEVCDKLVDVFAQVLVDTADLKQIADRFIADDVSGAISLIVVLLEAAAGVPPALFAALESHKVQAAA